MHNSYKSVEAFKTSKSAIIEIVSITPAHKNEKIAEKYL